MSEHECDSCGYAKYECHCGAELWEAGKREDALQRRNAQLEEALRDIVAEESWMLADFQKIGPDLDYCRWCGGSAEHLMDDDAIPADTLIHDDECPILRARAALTADAGEWLRQQRREAFSAGVTAIEHWILAENVDWKGWVNCPKDDVEERAERLRRGGE